MIQTFNFIIPYNVHEIQIVSRRQKSPTATDNIERKTADVRRLSYGMSPLNCFQSLLFFISTARFDRLLYFRHSQTTLYCKYTCELSIISPCVSNTKTQIKNSTIIMCRILM